MCLRKCVRAFVCMCGRVCDYASVTQKIGAEMEDLLGFL